MKNIIAVATTLLLSSASAKIFFQENFDDAEWQSRWNVPSKNTAQLGSWEISSGKFFADEKINQGLRTVDNMRFYALTAPFSEPVSNANGDLIIQFSAKNEQNLNCGGAYVKILSKDVDIDSFSGQTPYKIMFGPDVCGSNRRVHLILSHGDQGRMIKERVDFANDELTHIYTLVLSQPAQTYRILIDGEEVATGSIIDDIEGMSEEPRTIPDPNAEKPADWDDRKEIADPEDVKPANWDAEHPATIADPEAEKPADWDEATQGTWTAPQIPNPDYVEWTPRTIPNPAYQGPWSAPQIPNPKFKANPNAGVYSDLAHIAFDLWQVKAGTIFDNLLVTDDISVAQKQLEQVYSALKQAEVAAERAWFKSMHPEAEAQAEQAVQEAEQAVQASEGEDSFGTASEGEHTEL